MHFIFVFIFRRNKKEPEVENWLGFAFLGQWEFFSRDKLLFLVLVTKKRRQ
jgi:hypothetical protein